MLLTLVAMLSLSGCAQTRDDALVSLFEFDFKHLPPICLSVFGEDPSDALLARIAKHRANVFPASQCRPEASGGYTHNSAKMVQMIRIIDSEWRGLKTVAFDVVYDSNFMLGSRGETIIVERLNGFWMPTGNDPDGSWVS